MRTIIYVALMGCCGSVGFAAPPVAFTFPRSTPEEQGIASPAVLDFVEAAEKDTPEMHSFMLVRHGHVVAEGWWAPYDAATRQELYSLSKSFTSTAVGLAIAEGRLSLLDPVISFFPEETPAEVSDNLRGMRVKQLLCMSTGHDKDASEGTFGAPDGAMRTLPIPLRPAPSPMETVS